MGLSMFSLKYLNHTRKFNMVYPSEIYHRYSIIHSFFFALRSHPFCVYVTGADPADPTTLLFFKWIVDAGMNAS